MSDGVHILVPFASATSPACIEAIRALRLPTLEKLLARLQPAEFDTGDLDTLSLPHERALARHWGIAPRDGCMPLAALAAKNHAGACAWITPCRWHVATDHIRMTNPADLAFDEAGSRAIFDAVQPYFEGDGISLSHAAPGRWLAQGDIFDGLATASLDRVSGRVIDPWIPRAPKAAPLRRLQQEVQMLLYTHPANDAREARGAPPVNSFWVSGTGRLPPVLSPQPFDLHVHDGLRAPALQDDWRGWTDAWQVLDLTQLAHLRVRAEAGESVQLTLCGERSARTWVSAAAGGYWRTAAARLAQLLGRSTVAPVLESL